MIITRSYFCKGQFAPFLPLAGQKPYCKGQNPA